MSFIPFATAWVGAFPTSMVPVSPYFADMALAAVAFHIMYYLIACERGMRSEFRLSVRSVVSLAAYTLAAMFGGRCPAVAYVAAAPVTCMWIVPEKKGEQARPAVRRSLRSLRNAPTLRAGGGWHRKGHSPKVPARRCDKPHVAQRAQRTERPRWLRPA